MSTGRLRPVDGGWQIVFTPRLAHPPEKVWAALTEPDSLRAWFPNEMHGERTEGAPLRFTFPGKGDKGAFDGQMRTWDPPRTLAFRWGEDELRFELRADGDGTLLTLIDTIDDVSRAARDAAGWHECLDRLQVELDGEAADFAPDERREELHPVYVQEFQPQVATTGPSASSRGKVLGGGAGEPDARTARRSHGNRWEGDAYAAQAAHHRSFDDWFLDRHPPRPDDEVVDAGCGTGEFTARVAEMVPHGRVIGVDPDPSMLAAARAHTADNVEFRQGGLQHLDRACEPASADLVLSRAVFHWIPLAEYLDCYRAILRVLEPGGWFHAESGGAGNLAHVVEVLDGIAADHGLGPAHPTFPDAGTAFGLLEQAGFDIPDEGVVTVAQRRAFDRDRLRGFLHTQACLPYVAQVADDVREAFLADVDERLAEFRRHDQSYDQTFVRLVVRCRRPE